MDLSPKAWIIPLLLLALVVAPVQAAVSGLDLGAQGSCQHEDASHTPLATQAAMDCCRHDQGCDGPCPDCPSCAHAISQVPLSGQPVLAGRLGTVHALGRALAVESVPLPTESPPPRTAL